MLEELEVRNLGPIRAANLALGPGMTAITGETGAGKSMLLSAIQLISGSAASSARVTPGADDAWAQGVFEVMLSGRAARISGEAGLPPQGSGREQASVHGPRRVALRSGANLDVADDAGVGEDTTGELFLSRQVPASGRSRAILDGHTVPQALLGEVSGELVTIHGQADQMRMASPARQREFLDAVADCERESEAYTKAWDALQAADAQLKKIMTQESAVTARVDYLRDSIAQIDKVDPKEGEDVELKERRSRIENAEEIATGVGSALMALDSSQVALDSDGDAEGASAVELINRAIDSLRSIRVEGGFDDTADRLESINTDLADVVYTLSGRMNEVEDAGSLDSINSRIHELDELMRRWGPELSDVITWREKAGYEVEDLDASPQKVEELKAKRAELFDAAVEAAERLSAKRAAAASDLAASVTRELGQLAMGGARFEIRVVRRQHGGSGAHSPAADPASMESGLRRKEETTGFRSDPLDAHGMDDIEFLFTPFPGSPRLPMGKSASGGELSRLMLALELSAASRRQAVNTDMTFIFDEVDAGVGGKAAVELGKRLAQLARTSQVIVVTHLPQVASWADAQFVVSKGGVRERGVSDSGGTNAATETVVPAAEGSVGRSGVETTVTKVEGEARVREIARMLSGAESKTSLDHARELLAASNL